MSDLGAVPLIPFKLNSVGMARERRTGAACGRASLSRARTSSLTATDGPTRSQPCG